MATFREQIENLAGKTVSDTTAQETEYFDMLNTFLKVSARGVLDILPAQKLRKQSNLSELDSSTTNIDVTDKRILHVIRNGYGCIEVPVTMKQQVESSSGSIYEPTKKSPVFYIYGQNTVSPVGGRLIIKPTCTDTEKGQVFFTVNPTPLHTESGIFPFPDDAEYAVIISSAMKVLQHKINLLVHSDEDPELAQIATQELGVLVQMYQDEVQRLGGNIVPFASGQQQQAPV